MRIQRNSEVLKLDTNDLLSHMYAHIQIAYLLSNCGTLSLMSLTWTLTIALADFLSLGFGACREK